MWMFAISFLASFVCFIGVLIFNIYEFRRIASQMECGFNELSKRMEQGFNELSKRMEQGFNTLSTKLDEMSKRMEESSRRQEEQHRAMMEMLKELVINTRKSNEILERIEQRLR